MQTPVLEVLATPSSADFLATGLQIAPGLGQSFNLLKSEPTPPETIRQALGSPGDRLAERLIGLKRVRRLKFSLVVPPLDGLCPQGVIQEALHIDYTEEYGDWDEAANDSLYLAVLVCQITCQDPKIIRPNFLAA